MNDDIVTRLRRSTWRDCIEAADEIEWLRAQIVQMREQMFENLEVARAAIERLTAEAREANANAKLYRDERDVARRELLSKHIDPVAEAKRRNWDCFKEDGK